MISAPQVAALSRTHFSFIAAPPEMTEVCIAETSAQARLFLRFHTSGGPDLEAPFSAAAKVRVAADLR
jgi:hypothetical protein